MEKVIESLMSSSDEAQAMFDILRDLIGAAVDDDPMRLLEGLQALEPDIVRVCLAALVSITTVEAVDRAEKEFMAEVFHK